MATDFSTDTFKYARDSGINSRDATLSHQFDANLEDPLRESGRIPDGLGSAPISSWVLARLLEIAPYSMSENCKMANDGGGFAFDYVVIESDAVVGTFQLQGDSETVVLLGKATAEEISLRIVDDLVAVLVADPNSLRECRFEVRDPDWECEPSAYSPMPSEDTRNEYGWEHGVFLGRYNVRNNW